MCVKTSRLSLALYRSLTFNTNKRDNDDTHFRGVLDRYSHRDGDCLFCSLGADRVIAENELCIAIHDAFPVTDLHSLVIPKRHVSDYFDLHQPEINAVHAILNELKQGVRRQGFSNQWRLKLRESLAHLVGFIMRRAGGDASVAFRVSFV